MYGGEHPFSSAILGFGSKGFTFFASVGKGRAPTITVPLPACSARVASRSTACEPSTTGAVNGSDGANVVPVIPVAPASRLTPAACIERDVGDG